MTAFCVISNFCEVFVLTDMDDKTNYVEHDAQTQTKTITQAHHS
jgi:hypothetical protein